jgi:hypothetical protein
MTCREDSETILERVYALDDGRVRQKHVVIICIKDTSKCYVLLNYNIMYMKCVAKSHQKILPVSHACEAAFKPTLQKCVTWI